MEDKITLSLEELESIAGGDILQDRMNAEENAHYNKLHKRFVDVGVDYLNGDASKAEYDAAKISCGTTLSRCKKSIITDSYQRESELLNCKR